VDITPATAVAMSQLRTQNEFATRVLRKTLDISAQQGAELVKMVAEAGGPGQQIDLYA
jgi:hypothetical protein